MTNESDASGPENVKVVMAGPEFGARMQEIHQQNEREIRETMVEGISGGGMVRIVMNLSGEAQSVHIDPELHDRAMNEALNDLILAALQSARRNITAAMEDVDSRHQERIGRIMQDVIG